MRVAVGDLHATTAAMPWISHPYDERDRDPNRVEEVLDEVLTLPK